MTLKEVLQILPFDSNIEVRIISREDNNVIRDNVIRETIEFSMTSYIIQLMLMVLRCTIKWLVI